MGIGIDETSPACACGVWSGRGESSPSGDDGSLHHASESPVAPRSASSIPSRPHAPPGSATPVEPASDSRSQSVRATSTSVRCHAAWPLARRAPRPPTTATPSGRSSASTERACSRCGQRTTKLVHLSLVRPSLESSTSMAGVAALLQLLRSSTFTAHTASPASSVSSTRSNAGCTLSGRRTSAAQSSARSECSSGGASPIRPSGSGNTCHRSSAALPTRPPRSPLRSLLRS
mmetsp:Transcript_15195/g.34905  ORF Transcript_15195/g.34905 Transcript_15195/m.34905 type:complete len:232 (+) Transcript_15195:960-1655(+)